MLRHPADALRLGAELAPEAVSGAVAPNENPWVVRVLRLPHPFLELFHGDVQIVVIHVPARLGRVLAQDGVAAAQNTSCCLVRVPRNLRKGFEEPVVLVGALVSEGKQHHRA